MTREDAIKMLKSKMNGHTDTSYEWAETVRMAIEALQEQRQEILPKHCIVPSGDYVATAGEPKRGKWEYKEIANSSIVGYWCNQCHIGTSKAYDFCPHCGARMWGNIE